jgi:hypothetical protein
MSQQHETDHVKVWAATLVTFGAIVAMWAFMLPGELIRDVSKKPTANSDWSDLRQHVAGQADAFEQAMAETDKRLSEVEALQAAELRAQVAEDGVSDLRAKIEAAASAAAEGVVAGAVVEAPTGTETEPKLP